MKGVIDRIIEGKWAVILIGEEEIEDRIRLEMLPTNVKEGSVVQIKIENGSICALKLLEAETTAQLTRIQEKMNVLKTRKRSSFHRD